jgi:hypothetical protein
MIIAVTALEAIVDPAPHAEQLEIVGVSAIAILAFALLVRFAATSLKTAQRDRAVPANG